MTPSASFRLLAGLAGAQTGVPGTGHAALLRRVTEALVAALEPDDAAARLCGLMVPALADWSTVTLVDDDRPAGARGGLQHATACHRDPRLQPIAERYARARLEALCDDAPLIRSIRTGRPEVVTGDATPTVRAALRPGPARQLIDELAPDHVVVLPLPGRAGAVGLLGLYNGAERGAFTADDLAAAADIATRAGLVLDNARLYRQQRSLAEALQRSMLTAPPPIDGLQIAVRYTPAAEAAQIGGDWYDAFRHGPGATFVIGDVAGHDADAAAEMGQLRALLRGIAVATDAHPAALLASLDTAIHALQLPTIATAIVARLSPPVPAAANQAWRLRWTNAGHPPPVLAEPDGRVTVLHSRPDLLLGATVGSVRAEADVPLEPGATLLLYTDGLIERRGQPLDEGLDLLVRTIGQLVSTGAAHPCSGRDAHPLPSLDQFCDAILARLLPDRPHDDVALLAVRSAT